MLSAVSSGVATKRDYELAAFAGMLIGLLALPILATAKPALFSAWWLPVFLFFAIASPAGIFVASLLAKRIPLVWQLAKFVLIGGLNTLVDIGVLAASMAVLRDTAGVRPESIVIDMGIVVSVFSLYKAFSFIVANLNSYVWNKYWTFSSATKSTGAQFMQFFVVSLLGFLINNFIASYVFISVSPVGGMAPEQWGLIGAAVGSIAGLAWNFIGYKFVVFKER